MHYIIPICSTHMHLISHGTLKTYTQFLDRFLGDLPFLKLEYFWIMDQYVYLQFSV